jgi:SAM-dependent methyltransferase
MKNLCMSFATAGSDKQLSKKQLTKIKKIQEQYLAVMSHINYEVISAILDYMSMDKKKRTEPDVYINHLCETHLDLKLMLDTPAHFPELKGITAREVITRLLSLDWQDTQKIKAFKKACRTILDHNWEDAMTNAKAHYKTLYRHISERLVNIIMQMSRLGRDKLTIVDLGSGTAEPERLAMEHVLKKPPANMKVVFHAYDKTKKFVDQASQWINAMQASHPKSFSGGVTECNLLKTFPGYDPNSVDVFVASGFLCQGVISEKDARRLFAKICPMLKPGGAMIITGFTPPWIDRKDFMAAGLEVHQMTVPNENAKSSEEQERMLFYVVTK